MSAAVDREALVDVLYDFAGKGLTTYADKFETRRAANAVADAILASGVVRDVADVEHEHGERIAQWFEAQRTRPRTGKPAAMFYTSDKVADRVRDLSPKVAR